MYKAVKAVVRKVIPEVVLLLETGGWVTVRGKSSDARYRIGREVSVCFDYTECEVKEVIFDGDEPSLPTSQIFDSEERSYHE